MRQGPSRYVQRVQEVLLSEDEAAHFAFEVNAQDVVQHNPQVRARGRPCDNRAGRQRQGDA
jgi:hypothetical protein